MTGEELKKIKENLVSQKADCRKKALAEMKKLPVSEAMGILVEGLTSKNDDVHAELEKAFKSYKEVALPYLVKAFSHQSWNVRRAASHIIGSLGDGLLSKFLELIPKNEEDLDFWMVQTLSLMGGEAIAYLIKGFHHHNLKIRLAAIRAAANVKDPAIVSALVPLMEENQWPIRKAVFDTLLEVHQLNPEVITDALKNASREAKYWFIKVAADRRDPELVATFRQIVDHDAEELKLEAIRAMAMIETREVQKTLVGYLAHKSWIVRKTAADAIWVQGMSISDELVSALHGSNIDARYWSVKLLGQTNEPQSFT